MEKKQKKNPIQQSDNRVSKAINSMVTEGRGKILSDVLGSYTGTAENGEMPEQDADDL